MIHFKCSYRLKCVISFVICSLFRKQEEQKKIRTGIALLIYSLLHRPYFLIAVFPFFLHFVWAEVNAILCWKNVRLIHLFCSYFFPLFSHASFAMTILIHYLVNSVMHKNNYCILFFLFFLLDHVILCWYFFLQEFFKLCYCIPRDVSCSSFSCPSVSDVDSKCWNICYSLRI